MRSRYFKDVTDIPTIETIHIAHVLEQIARGYLTGGNCNRWRTNVFTNLRDPSWRPYQFYSSSCYRVYGTPKKAFASKENEQEALCTDAHLIRPLQGGRIAFSTLEGRPSAKDFEANIALQEWVSATDIKVVFDRISSSKTRDTSKYYAVSDLAVGGRCHCNGHAGSCSTTRDGRPVCDCKHHTAGNNCEKCKAFFNDSPWKPASETFANECVGKFTLLQLFVTVIPLSA